MCGKRGQAEQLSINKRPTKQLVLCTYSLFDITCVWTLMCVCLELNIHIYIFIYYMCVSVSVWFNVHIKCYVLLDFRVKCKAETFSSENMPKIYFNNNSNFSLTQQTQSHQYRMQCCTWIGCWLQLLHGFVLFWIHTHGHLSISKHLIVISVSADLFCANRLKMLQ